MSNTKIGVVLLSLLLGACQSEAPPPADVRTVRAEQVGNHAAQSSTRYAGEIRARHETELAFRVGGRVLKRSVEAGAQVKAGDVLATLDAEDFALASRAARAQLTAAEAEARLAEQDLARYTELRAKNFISDAELDRRRATATAAQSRAAQMRAEASRQGNQQDYTRLTAPHAGVVTRVAMEAGQVVAPGETVAELARTGEWEVSIDVPENALAALRRAQRLTIELWAEPDRRYAGRLRELSPMADAGSRTYQARIQLLEADAAVRLGMTATVDVADTAESALSVPQSAVFELAGQPQVWVVDPKSRRVAARGVRLGDLNADRATISAGLRSGEWVVTAGVHKIAAGQQVRLTAPESPAAGTP